jgi:hypothetical protein
MKSVLIMAMLAVTAVSYAKETKTECPWMAESTSRVNTKAKLEQKGAIRPSVQQTAIRQ